MPKAQKEAKDLQNLDFGGSSKKKNKGGAAQGDQGTKGKEERDHTVQKKRYPRETAEAKTRLRRSKVEEKESHNLPSLPTLLLPLGAHSSYHCLPRDQERETSRESHNLEILRWLS